MLMWPLGVCLAATMAAIVERLIVLRRRRVIPPDLEKMLEKVHSHEEATRLAPRLEKDGSALGQILRTVLASSGLGRQDAAAQVEIAGKRAAHALEKRLLLLESMAVVAPMLGLLGTVVGLSIIFQEFSGPAKGAGRIFSRGIAMALLTTIAGLSIAIPAYLGYAYLNRRVEMLVLELETYAARLLDVLHAGPAPGGAEGGGGSGVQKQVKA